MNRIYWVTVLLPILVSSCKAQQTFSSPAGYNLNAPEVIRLEKEMNEISGISYDASDNMVYAICDDKGSLYKISLSDGKIVRSLKFHKQRNFEDLVITGDSCYVLNSNGDIISFNYKTDEVKDAVIRYFPEKGKNELEILYHDKVANKLMLICKGCEQDKKKEVSTFYYYMATGEYSKGPFNLDAGKLLEKSSVEKNRFKPSAAAIHPVTGELYIISSINKLLLIADTHGKLKEAYPLDTKLFKQPEGLCFTPQADLLISNESARAGKATILIFKRTN